MTTTQAPAMTLTERIHALRDADPAMTLDDLTVKLADAMTMRERDQLFVSLLRNHVRLLLNLSRRDTQIPNPGQTPTDTQRHGAGVGHHPRRRKNYAAAIERRWAKALASDVSPDGKRRVRLADCTREDLLGVVAQYEIRATANMTQAAIYKRLADKLTAGQTVAQLAATDGMSAWEQAA